MTMLERLQTIAKRYQELSYELMQPENISNIKKMTTLLKEQSDLSEAYEGYQKYQQLLKNIEDTQGIVEDPELGELAKLELDELENKKGQLESELEKILLPKDPNDNKNVIIEIRGAAGGDEANIFAGDLFRMYSKYAEKRGWHLDVINQEEGTSGGFSQMEFMIKGKNVYSKLKYENGAHRVQRVPVTETQGRVHTSTATVLVMPEADEVDLEIKPHDIKVDVFKSGGAGGQSVNTTDSAVRITHLSTGTVVTCQNERSQIQNREKAMQLLRAKIYEETIRKQEEERADSRRNKIGTGDRSEKIRTYNYPQNRVTDHRISLTIKQLDRIIEGDLDEIIESLITEDQKRRLLGE